MTEKTVVDGEAPPAPARKGLSVGLFVVFAMMAWLAVVSIAYAVSMIGFLADGGYFLAYGSLCSTVPVIAGLDRFVPLVLAGLWLGTIYLGLARNPRFARLAIVTSLLSLAYGAANIIAGPFTFRVGPGDVDPSGLRCGRWPIAVTQQPGLDVMRIDFLDLPINVFAVSLVVLGLAIYVYLRVSKRVRAVYRRREPKAA